MTGTIEDQFTPIYLHLAIDTHGLAGYPSHRSFAPHEVDAMDLTTVWALMGTEQHAAYEAKQRADQAAKLQAAPGNVVMIPLTPEEKAERLARLQARIARGEGGRRRRRTEPRTPKG